MERFVLISRILGALFFVVGMFLYGSEKVATALFFGVLAAACVAVVLAHQLASFYNTYLIKRKRT